MKKILFAIASVAIFAGCLNYEQSITLGFKYLREGKYQEAARYLKKAINKTDTPSTHLYYNYGVALANSGHIEDALNAFTAATNADLSNIDAVEYGANMLIKLGRYSEAQRELNAIIESAKTSKSKARILTTLATCEVNLGYATIAYDHLLMATLIDNTFAPAYLGLAQILSESFQDHESAIKAYNSFLNLDHDSALDEKVMQKREETYKLISPHELAEADNQQATQQIRKAQTFYRSGNFVAAEKAYADALAINAHSKTASLGYADSIFKQSRFKDAIVAYQNAKELDGENLHIALQIVKAYQRNANTQEALRLYTQWIIPHWPNQSESYITAIALCKMQKRYYEARLLGQLCLIFSKGNPAITEKCEQILSNVPSLPLEPPEK